jgi:hypothetical protein
MKQTDLALLGYSSRWLDYGFLTPDDLQAQVAFFLASEDRNTEHYRYATFQSERGQQGSAECRRGDAEAQEPAGSEVMPPRW